MAERGHFMDPASQPTNSNESANFKTG